MKFFFPDTQDFVDPSFDFRTEQRNELRVRQRDDLYAHEIFSAPPYDGMLVSKAAVDQLPGGATRYTAGQRQRLMREGLASYLRLDHTKYGRRVELMGDCGGFSYVREEFPPYSVDEVVHFYSECGFDYGISVDHVILGFKSEAQKDLFEPPDLEEWRRRQNITLDLADEFLKASKTGRLPFKPLGVAQAWSPSSYASAVDKLQKMGYDYICLGGMVPLKTPEILESLEAISAVRHSKTKLHLLGVTRCEHVWDFKGYGVASFDSTSPLRKAFKDDKDNYYAPNRTYTAVRIPQIDKNTQLLRKIKSGQVNQDEAAKYEASALRTAMAYDAHELPLEDLLEALAAYERLYDDKRTYIDVYGKVLAETPWKSCPCEICRDLGIHVILFRGAERNRRRGFHNLYVFYQQLQDRLGEGNTIKEHSDD